jgi:hypothetical protein
MNLKNLLKSFLNCLNKLNSGHKSKWRIEEVLKPPMDIAMNIVIFKMLTSISYTINTRGTNQYGLDLAVKRNRFHPKIRWSFPVLLFCQKNMR